MTPTPGRERPLGTASGPSSTTGRGVAHAQAAYCGPFPAAQSAAVRRRDWDLLILPTCLVSTNTRSVLLVRRFRPGLIEGCREE